MLCVQQCGERCRHGWAGQLRSFAVRSLQRRRPFRLPQRRKPAISGAMNEPLHPALLPLGLRDLLPPDAASEALVVGRMMAVLESHGYQRVKPPLVEFEDSLLSGPGAAMASETFRLMDPISQRMIGIRADMTPQVARIAATRLRHAPRPLRLCYAGQVLRIKGGQLRPERQIGQVGAELIGADSAAADVEAIALAAEALAGLGISGLSVDLTLPRLVPAICASLGIAGKQSEIIRAALDHKDAAKLAESGGGAAPLLGKLLAAAGPAKTALAALTPLAMPPQLLVLRSRRARRARPRRPLCRRQRGARDRGARAGDRLYPLYRHGAWRGSRVVAVASPLSARRGADRYRPRAARRGLGDRRRPRRRERYRRRGAPP